MPALIKVTDILGVDRNFVINQLTKFKNLNHRIHEVCSQNGISFINDSKATSFSATEIALSSIKNIYWILGGLPKKNDKLNLSKIKKNIRELMNMSY